MALTCAVTESGDYARNLAARKSMNDSSPSGNEPRETSPADSAAEIAMEFPVATANQPGPPPLDPAEFVTWCEEMMLLLGTKQEEGEEKRRLAPKAPGRFVV